MEKLFRQSLRNAFLNSMVFGVPGVLPGGNRAVNEPVGNYSQQ